MKFHFQYLLAIFGLLTSVQSQSRKRYDNVSVLRAYPDTQDAVDYLRSMETLLPGSEFWRFSNEPGSPSDLMVTPGAMRREAEQKLTAANIRYGVAIDNVQELIDAEEVEMGEAQMPAAGRAGGREAFDLEAFHSYDEIMSWMEYLGEEFADLASVHSIGRTYEGREIKVLRIGRSTSAGLAVWIDGGIHAREWLSPATVLWLIDRLLTGSDGSYLVDSITWYFLPVHNPDGYEYTREYDRLWRKNRQPTHAYPRGGGQVRCIGTDPNRNYNTSDWCAAGVVSHDGCRDVYCGTAPESAPCVAAVADYIRSLLPDISLYISMHTFSQLLLLADDSTAPRPGGLPNYWKLMLVAKAATDALEAIHGKRYKYGQASDIIYRASGSSLDWAHHAAGIPYSYTFELRDDWGEGTYGFLAPPAEIRPTGEEIWAAVKAMVRAISANKIIN